MSKSYDNYIALKDEPDVIRKKVAAMITDPRRVKKADKGHPDVCNVFSYYKIFKPGMEGEITEWCKKAKKGCTECKRELADVLIDYLKDIREKRKALISDKEYIQGVLKEGREKAGAIASDTITQIKKAAGMA
jgi:tryptophanyl-tRNA synthetase